MMPTRFRLIASDGASLGVADTLEGVVKLTRDIPQGRYQIEEFSVDPATGNPQSWEWGTLTKKRMFGLKRPPTTPDGFMEVRIVPHGRPRAGS